MSKKMSPTCHDRVTIVSTNKNDKNVKKKNISALNLDFEIFWNCFPSGRKKSKGAAQAAWVKALGITSADRIIARARDYAASPEGNGPYVKMPSTWLNQRCWDDADAAWNLKSDDAAKHSAVEQEAPKRNYIG